MIKNFLGSLLLKKPKLWNCQTSAILVRNYVAPAKRFYRKTSILQSDGKFEITLDNKKLKTPYGKTFTVENELLATAVATEWDSQKDVIERSNMHLTALCNTALDNPNKLEKYDLVNYLVNFLQTDTILFHSSDEKRLEEIQENEWSPIISWFNKEFEADLKETKDICVPTISPQTRMNVSKFLASYNLPSLHGFTFAVDTLKSLVLTCAVVKRLISVEKAVLLSRLEEEFQLGHWGRVEWAHDMSQQELQARLASSIFFIYCNSSSYLVKQKIG